MLEHPFIYVAIRITTSQDQVLNNMASAMKEFLFSGTRLFIPTAWQQERSSLPLSALL